MNDKSKEGILIYLSFYEVHEAKRVQEVKAMYGIKSC